MRFHVDLIIPGLFNLPLQEIPVEFLTHQLPGLNHLLRFSAQLINQLYEFESIIADCAGFGDLQYLPFAQVYTGDNSSAKNNCMLCRCVHLKADMNSAYLIPIENNSIDLDDSSLIINDLKEFFKDDCELTELSDGLWLMQLKLCKPPQHFPHYLSAIGKKVNQYIEQSQQDLPWYKLNNEMQMFLHQHPINQNRLQTGLLPINSLWCWGAGAIPAELKSKVSWYCNDQLLKDFGEASDVSVKSLNKLGGEGVNDNSLVIHLGLLEALKSSESIKLIPVMKDLDEVLIKLIESNRSSNFTLRLRTGSQFDYQLSPYASFRRWRKPKTLFDFVAS